VVAVPEVCRIVADVHERASGLPHALRARGAVVDVAPLTAGDYDVSSGCLVERKTVRDLHESLRRGRLWAQIAVLRRTARVPYLLVEGAALGDGPLADDQVRGACLAVLAQGVAVLRSADRNESASWLVLLASRRQRRRVSRDRPTFAQRLQSSAGTAPQAMLAAVPGISTVTARRLLNHFGTVQGVLLADPAEWLTVSGVGPTRAAALLDAVTRNHSRPQGA